MSQSGSPPDSVGSPELLHRIVELADDFRARTAIPYVLRIDPAHVRLAPAAHDVVCWAIRELLENVRKHVGATLVSITSERRRNGSFAITVADNGIGLPPPSQIPRPACDGAFRLWSTLHSMTELGGRLEFNNSGTKATLIVPKDVTHFE